MRNDRPTQPPPNQSQPPAADDPARTPVTNDRDVEEADTRVAFVSWDLALVPG